MRARLHAALAAALLALVLPACDVLDVVTLDEIQERDLRVNWNRWTSSDIDDYRYFLVVECACSADQQREVEVVVENGEPVSVTYYDTGEPAPRALFADFDTVDELFFLIEDALDQDADVAVLYESRYALGYPESVILDYDEFRTGDELAFVMTTDLEILE